jgi:hypothetical protein
VPYEALTIAHSPVVANDSKLGAIQYGREHIEIASEPHSVADKHLPAYSVIVTSVLRTDADVKSLSRTNINASKRSVHCYGTTVDITYTRFMKHDDEGPSARDVDLKAVLTEVLRDMREQGRCYVKYEVKQACFHITARK